MIDFAPNEIIVDNFAGGGGASLGMEWALGRQPDIAVNHDQKALAMHRANHPDTVHLCEDVWAVDIVKEVAGRPVGLAWFSPDCKHFSKAKGGKPVEKKIRGLAWVALKWAGSVHPRVIMLENVEEFRDWGPIGADGQPCKRRKGMTFKRWCTQLRNLGYILEHRERRACVDGAPTIRKRLFVIARNDGQPIVWPEATHGKDKTPYRTAAECIDWSIPCPSIFLSREQGRKVGVNRPLADATMERIAKGVFKYVLNCADPFIVNLTHQGGDRNESVREPFRTLTGANRGEKAVVSPIIARVAHGERDKKGKKRGQGTHSPAEPLGTVTASPEFSVVAPYLATYYGANRPGGDRTADLQEPLRTVVTENRHALVTPFLAQHNTGRIGHDARQPLSTITGRGTQQSAVMPFLAGVGGRMGQTPARGVDQPYHTTTAKADTVLAAPLLTRHFGNSVGSPIDQPAPTTTAGGGGKTALSLAFISKMRGTNVGHPASDPLHTVSAGGTHFAEVTAKLVEADPGEFPESAFEVARFLTKYAQEEYDSNRSNQRVDSARRNRVKAKRGVLETGADGQPGTSAQDRTEADGIPFNQRIHGREGVHRREAVSSDGAHSSVDATGGADPQRDRPQPQGRQQGKQRPSEPGTGHARRESRARVQDRLENTKHRAGRGRTINPSEAASQSRSELPTDRPDVEREQNHSASGSEIQVGFIHKYYGTDQDPQLLEPMHSITTKGRFAVVIVTIRGTDYVIVDIGMRMLTPRELFRAQGFPDDYVIDHGVRVQGTGDTADLFATEIPLTLTEQIRMCGNSVSPYPAAALVRAQFASDLRSAVA